MKSIFLCLFLLPAIFTIPSCSKDKNGSIKIVVTGINPDLTISVISGANVKLKEEDNTLLSEKLTDANGEVIFSNLESGKYKIHMEYDFNHDGSIAAYEVSDFVLPLADGEDKVIPISR